MDCPKCGYLAGPEDKYCPMCETRLSGHQTNGGIETSVPGVWKQHSAVVAIAGVLAVGLVVLLVLLVGAGGGAAGGGSPSVAGTGTGATAVAGQTGQQAQGAGVYTDPTFGFTITCPAGWQVLQGLAAQGSPGAAPVDRISVVDTAGTTIGADSVDLLQLSVYQLPAPVDASTIGGVRPQVEAVITELLQQSDDPQVIEPLSEVTLGGLPGFRTGVTCTTGGVPLTMSMYFLFSGSLQYQLTLQASTSVWQAKQPVMEAILASFSAGGSSSTTTTTSSVIP